MPEEYVGDSFVETIADVKSLVTDVVDGETELITETEDPETDKFRSNNTLIENDNATLIESQPAEGPSFYIRAAPGYRYFVIESGYGLVRDIKSRLSHDGAQELLAEYDEYNYDPETLEFYFPDADGNDEMTKAAAALTVVDAVHDETTEKLVYHLVEAFASACVKHHISASEVNGGITEFRVYYKIFPYEEEFSIQNLNRTIEQVRLATHYGQLFLQRSFNLGINQANKDEAITISPEANPP